MKNVVEQKEPTLEQLSEMWKYDQEGFVKYVKKLDPHLLTELARLVYAS